MGSPKNLLPKKQIYFLMSIRKGRTVRTLMINFLMVNFHSYHNCILIRPFLHVPNASIINLSPSIAIPIWIWSWDNLGRIKGSLIMLQCGSQTRENDMSLIAGRDPYLPSHFLYIIFIFNKVIGEILYCHVNTNTDSFKQLEEK